MTRPLAERIVAELTRRGEHLAVAESLTGGMLTAALVDVPGASAVLVGGVVAYATPLKASVLYVDGALLAERGAVDPQVARQMAAGARERLVVDGRVAEHGVSTTGVAGPESQDGHPPGTVWIGYSSQIAQDDRGLLVVGDRAAVREAAVDGALELLADHLGIPHANPLEPRE
ncbi:CinA family protein [Homoserinibacter sp. GY 40078]|uniref:CinA family protein n=1 Tax=Homoserinibacter sp. GY 40078 TaxID=2603275 RepID=UPI0011C89F46|nr:CinA family protein [Homoserinibacter sp. GY 40078]TXK19828.1 CinA family protein [Homoserinibacter sp. GY 40078]